MTRLLPGLSGLIQHVGYHEDDCLQLSDEGADRQDSMRVLQGNNNHMGLVQTLQFRLIPPETTTIRIRFSHARHL